LFKTKNFSIRKKSGELNSLKCYDSIRNIPNTSNIYDSKIKTETENFNDDKRIVHTLKFVLLDLERFFLEKNKCQKRMKNLLNDKKEIIQLKKQNLDRYNSRLKALFSARNRLENILKQEENINNLNSSGAARQQIFFNAKINTLSNTENNTNNNNSNIYTAIATNADNPLRSSCEKKSDYNSIGSSGNSKPTAGLNNLTTMPNLTVADKSFKMNSNTANNKIENLNNSSSISNSKEKYQPANTNNYNQNIQKLTAIIYKISAVNERIERISNLHESTLSEIDLSEEILIKQMKNIEASINRIKKQLSNSDYHSAKKDFNDSIELLRKELLENNFLSLNNIKNNNNNNNNTNLAKNDIENTECDKIYNTTNNTVADMARNLNTNVNVNDNNLSLNTDNNKKVEKLFDKIYEMKRLLEDKDAKLKYIQTDNSNKEKLIQDLQKKIDYNFNKVYLNKQNSDEANNNLNRNSFKTDNNKIKDEDYYCNYGNEKKLNLEIHNSKQDNLDNPILKSDKNNSFVNINNTIYNISLTPQKNNSVNPSSEKINNSSYKNKLPPTNKKKF